MDEINYNREINKILKYILIVIVLIITALLIVQIKVDDYKNMYGIYESDIKFYMSKEELNVLSYEYCYIDNKKQKYKVISISEELIINDSKYYEVILKINVDNKYKIKNNVIKIKFENGKANLINKIIKRSD